MPKNLITAYAIKLKRPEKELEKKWEKAKAISIKNGMKETDNKFYAYVVTVFQRLLGVNDEDGKPLGLQDVNNNKAFKVSEGVVPSFKDFILESSPINYNEATKRFYVIIIDFVPQNIVADIKKSVKGTFKVTNIGELSTELETEDSKVFNNLKDVLNSRKIDFKISVETQVDESLSISQKKQLIYMFTKSMDKFDDSMSTKDFATVVGKLFNDNYGKHNVGSFISTFRNQIKD
jgi:hypothetical protein